jgi:hypothetical protein
MCRIFLSKFVDFCPDFKKYSQKLFSAPGQLVFRPGTGQLALFGFVAVGVVGPTNA